MQEFLSMDDISNYVKRLMASIESLHEKNVHLEAELHNTVTLRESETAIAVHDHSEPENLPSASISTTLGWILCTCMKGATRQHVVRGDVDQRETHQRTQVSWVRTMPLPWTPRNAAKGATGDVTPQ